MFDVRREVGRLNDDGCGRYRVAGPPSAVGIGGRYERRGGGEN
jgi:hypothetical protein